jgi:omega-6 fatty acid desaturase (delta-12 desaturase)
MQLSQPVSVDDRKPNRAARDSETVELQRAVSSFQDAQAPRAIWQLANSLGGLIATAAAMYLLLEVSFWLSLALAPVAAGFLVRVFILQHDCGHGSLFRKRSANRWVGRLCSLFTMTPFDAWSRQHAVHHVVWNDLDRRQSGADIYSSAAGSGSATGWCAIR